MIREFEVFQKCESFFVSKIKKKFHIFSKNVFREELNVKIKNYLKIF